MQQKRQKRLSRNPQRIPQTTNTTLISNTTHISPYKISKKRSTSVTIPTYSYSIGRREQVEKRQVSKIQQLTNNEKNNFVRKDLKLKIIQRRQEKGLGLLNKIPKKYIQLLLQSMALLLIYRIKSLKAFSNQVEHPKRRLMFIKLQTKYKVEKLITPVYKQNEQVNRKKDTKNKLHNQRDILKESKSQQRCKKRSITSITKKNSLLKEIQVPRQKMRLQLNSLVTKENYQININNYKFDIQKYIKHFLMRVFVYSKNNVLMRNCQNQQVNEVYNIQQMQIKIYQLLKQHRIKSNRDEINYLKEFGILENEFNRITYAATKIQKVWRGFITRKIILDQQFEQYYYKQPEVFNEETFRSLFRLEKDSQSIQQGREQTLNQLTYQTDLNFILDLESEKKDEYEQKSSPNMSDKFVKYQKMKWQELLNYISKLEKQAQEKTIDEVLKDLKLFAQQCSQDCSISRFQIKKLEIQVPQFSQESMVMNEIRQAICSEKLIRQILTTSNKIENESIFEVQSFNQFALKKIDKDLNRSQIDEKSQYQVLTKQFEQKYISPKTFQERYQTLEKWVNKQYEDIENNKIGIEKGWQGFYNTFIQTEKELKFLKQQKYSQYSQFSNSQQFRLQQQTKLIHQYKKSLQELSNQNETALINNQTEEFENNHLKTHTSISQSPDENVKFQHFDNNHETIDWDDKYLLQSQQIIPNHQTKDSKINYTVKNVIQIGLEQAEMDYQHQEVQNEELLVG